MTDTGYTTLGSIYFSSQFQRLYSIQVQLVMLLLELCQGWLLRKRGVIKLSLPTQYMAARKQGGEEEARERHNPQMHNRNQLLQSGPTSKFPLSKVHLTKNHQWINLWVKLGLYDPITSTKAPLLNTVLGQGARSSTHEPQDEGTRLS